MITLEERFWSKVNLLGPNTIGTDCYIWTAYRNAKGYGVLTVSGKQHLAHRIAWFLDTGIHPEGLVCHSCDNPSCVRFDHLWIGTNEDNYRDMISKNRHSHCESHPRAKLTISQVEEIKALSVSMTNVELGRLFNVDPSTVSRIKHDKQWTLRHALAAPKAIERKK